MQDRPINDRFRGIGKVVEGLGWKGAMDGCKYSGVYERRSGLVTFINQGLKRLLLEGTEGM